MNTDYPSLLASIKTRQEMLDLSSELDSIMLRIFRSEKNTLEKALLSTTPFHAELITQSIARNKIDTKNQKKLKDFLNNAKSSLDALKIVNLTLAFNPTLKTIEKIHDFVKKNIGDGYILDIEVSENIIGGAIVMFDGKYKDYSLKKSLEEVFMKQKQEILKLNF